MVDDEVDHADVMAEALRRLGHVCTIVHDLPSSQDELRHGLFDLVVTDLVMDSEDAGLKVLETARQTQPMAETILVTAHGDVPTCKSALKQGAFDFIEKPLDLEVFRTLCTNAIRQVMLRSQNEELRERLDEQYGFEGIIGHSPQMRQVIMTMRQVAVSNIPVLVTGESGTGKELVAQAIHNNSPRSMQRFVPLNCAGLSDSILEDELFGHVKGAFTGAEREREGRFEYADAGTLFLDEVGDMPLLMQAKLLRVLESGEIIRVGDNVPRHVDVRLISATNQILEDLVKAKAFRQDLFFRINGVQIRLPALRERREDIVPLLDHYVQQFAKQLQKPARQVAPQVVDALMKFDWPGNVRQLMNVVQNMVVVAEGQTLELHHLPAPLRQESPMSQREVDISAGLTLEQLEKGAIRSALRATSGNREHAARMLGIGERTLYRKLKEYGLK